MYRMNIILEFQKSIYKSLISKLPKVIIRDIIFDYIEYYYDMKYIGCYKHDTSNNYIFYCLCNHGLIYLDMNQSDYIPRFHIYNLSNGTIQSLALGNMNSTVRACSYNNYIYVFYKNYRVGMLSACASNPAPQARGREYDSMVNYLIKYDINNNKYDEFKNVVSNTDCVFLQDIIANSSYIFILDSTRGNEIFIFDCNTCNLIKKQIINPPVSYEYVKKIACNNEFLFVAFNNVVDKYNMKLELVNKINNNTKDIVVNDTELYVADTDKKKTNKINVYDVYSCKLLRYFYVDAYERLLIYNDTIITENEAGSCLRIWKKNLYIHNFTNPLS